jgi:hypothetical protein
MEKQLNNISEVDYDFILQYWKSEPPSVGDKIESGITDDNEMTVLFIGEAVVVATSSKSCTDEITKTSVYVKQFYD